MLLEPPFGVEGVFIGGGSEGNVVGEDEDDAGGVQGSRGFVQK